MPLVAIDKSGNRVDITKEKTPQQLRGESFFCQCCNSKMVVRAGLLRIPHFSHSQKCLNEYTSHPESKYHLEGKFYLSQEMPKLFSDLIDCTAIIEYRMPEIKRIADIVFLLPNGFRIVTELQLASITTEQLKERTEDYLSAGCDVVWWLGKSANTVANREWVNEHQGICFQIDFIESGKDTVISQQH